jgi:serine protease
MKLFTLSCLCFISFAQAKNYILTPRNHHVRTFNYNSFAKEHNLDVLVNINDLTVYKTHVDNYNVFSGTLEELFEIEEDQDYSINPKFVENVIFVQQPGEFEFKVQEFVPWHLDRISKRHLPLNGSYAYSEPRSCHRNSEVEIETYVVDTGVQLHTEFGHNQPTFLENFSGDNINEDCNSHGTFCSSQIGGLNAGVCKDSKLFAVKVLTCEGSGSTSGVIAGMDYVFKRHLQREKENPKVRSIMSMSLGGGYSRIMNSVVEKMVKTSDTFYIVVASGNEAQDAKNTSPASARGILTANAMDRNDKRAYFSNYGSCTDIYSPGVSNYGAVLDNKYAVESGTSFSTPILAGIMNHYLDMYPHLNMKQLKDKILSDATKDTIEANPKNTPNLMVFLKRNDDNN